MLHAAGAVKMTVVAEKTNDDKLTYDFKIAVPGEFRLNE
jgi:hypothetical protein